MRLTKQKIARKLFVGRCLVPDVQDITPQRDEDRSGWLLCLGAAGMLAVVLAGLGLGLLDTKTPLVEQLLAVFR